MGLADIKGMDSLDLLAEIIEPLTSIAMDDKAMKMFKGGTVPKGMSKDSYAMKLMHDSLPVLLAKHKKEIVQILAACKQVSVKEYEKDLTIDVLMNDTMDLLNDDVFASFLSSQATTSTSFGNALESTSE